MGVDILSNSWGSYGESSALEEAISKADSAGILFIAAAGNDGYNTDIENHYPSCYDLPNIISVAASDDNDQRSVWGGGGGGNNSGCGSCSLSPQYGEPIPFRWNHGQQVIASPGSNYGPSSVDLAAPGTSIYSTVPGGYRYFSGTSMATPFVAGAASLIKSQNPAMSHLDIKNILLQNTDYLADFEGKTVTEGRLNVHKVLITSSSLASK
jgi:subtilisin family serine protease